MRIRLALPIPVLALAAVVAALFAAVAVAGPVASSAQARSYGLADQDVATLSDPRFLKSGIKKLRVAIPYDQVRRGGKLRDRQDTYLKTARKLHISVLVSFYRTSSCSPRCAARRLPSVSGFRSDFRRFRKRYPWIKTFSTWNEENYPLAQPTGRNPKRTGQFYLMLRRECRGGKCSVLTGDFRANGSKFDVKWLKAFKKTIGGGSHSWGLISYPDVNKYSTKYTRQFLRDTKGPITITETGGINIFGRYYKASLKRQNKAMKYLFGRYSHVSNRIKTTYVYQWKAAPTSKAFDSALINADGTPRPAYYTFFRALHRRAPK